MKVEFFPAAEQELIETADDYEGKARGLGSDFILEIERTEAVLVELPSLGEKLDTIHRSVSLQHFPYALIFRRDGDAVRVVAVVAVAHHRRRPQYWIPRVQDR